MMKGLLGEDSEQPLLQGMDRISTVVQRNSAASEESAASSKELSNLAQELKLLEK